MVTIAPIGSIRPVQTGRIQTQTHNEIDTTAYQQQYDNYNNSVEEYNAAVQQYKQVERSYNEAVQELANAEQSGNVEEIKAAGWRAEGLATAVNNSLTRLEQSEQHHNNSLLSLVNSGLISSDEASQREIHNSYTQIDPSKLTTATNNAVISASAISWNNSLITNYNDSLSKLKESDARLQSLEQQYNSATTAEERASLREQINSEIETANTRITEYNTALQTAQNYGLVDKSRTAISSLENIPAEQAMQSETNTRSTERTPFGIISNIANDLGAGLTEKTSNAKLKDSGLGIGGFLALNVLGATAAKGLEKVSETSAKIEDAHIKVGESLLGAIEPARQVLYHAGQWMNPSDENVETINREKIDFITSILGTDNPVSDVLIGMVNEKKSTAQANYETATRLNTIADVIGGAGDMMSSNSPTSSFIADKIETGIRMDADYIQYGMIGSDGNIHAPGLLHGVATGLVGGVIGAGIASAGGVGVSALPTAAKSFVVNDILGISTGGGGLTLEGLSTSEHLASRGMTGAGRSIQQAGENAVVSPSSNVFKAEFINGVEGGFRITPGEIIDGVRGGLHANPGDILDGVNGGFKATQGEMIDGVRGGFHATPGDLLTGVDGGMKANPGEVITGVDGGFKATIGNMFNPFSGNADILGDGNYGSINANGYPMRKDRLVELETSGIKHSDLLRETDIFKDSNSYSHSDRYANDDLFGDSIAFPTSNRQSYETSGSLLHGTVFGNMLGNTFGERYKHENKTEYDYVYEYEYPARPARSKRTHDIDWDDDDILSQSRSRKKKSSRNDVWREILRL